ncbi:2-nitropropane dioxygenase [Coccidioides immitis RMSCC 3703]|uniref:2-nitropropane dioxygenase n=1 Tax=Coccidioides immitis RMSCC 3703 TaxID=454286 RepID=A0A0J8TM18_COCIT|nr:2-nitropropane dioxygenase [Coccidioides immitis RMSCC 3703]
MPFNTELTRKLGIEIPVVQGGMQWVGYAELAAAVSNVGGLGILTALTQPTPEDLRKEIRRTRTMTKKPFGVNITLLPALTMLHMLRPSLMKYPGPVIKQLKAAGCIILHKCTTFRHAKSAREVWVDFLSIDGFECAGHVGETDITNFILLSRARQDLGVPFIASGGFADGYGLAAALALGAEGINMGTRFMCTVEAPIHINVKKAIVDAQEDDTQLLLRRWRNTTRLFKNKVSTEAYKIEKESKSDDFSEIAPFVSGKRGRQVFLDGDVDYGVWTAGQVIGLIHDIPTCEELLKRIEREAVEAMAKTSALYAPSSARQSKL